MNLLVQDAAVILDRYDAKRKARGLDFTPPPDKAALGRFAFAEDVFLTILLGVITGVLTHAAVQLLSWPFRKRDSAGGLGAEEQNPPSANALVTEIKNSTGVVQQGIEKLQTQGVKADEAKVALDLLLEALREVLDERAPRVTLPPQSAPSRSV